jgi:DNA-binding transcriptional LysR family regulator
MLNSDDLVFFSILASSESMAQAARKLNVTPPTVSTKLQNMEKKAGVLLVQRRSSGLLLTEAGIKLFEDSKPILKNLEVLNSTLNRDNSEISGKISVVGPIGFGEKKLAPLISNFIKKYPNVSVDLQLSDRPKWNDCTNTDIMFYIGQLKDSSLIKLRISPNKRLLCASPDYLKSNEVITEPYDLKKHRCIALQENDEDTCNWRFKYKPSSKIHNIRIQPYLVSNIADVVKCWAIHGLGIIQRSEWDVSEEIESGKLIEILPDYSLPDADIVALVESSSDKRTKKVNAFINYAKENLT